MPPHYLSSVFYLPRNPRDLHSFPTRRSSDLPSFVNITPKSVASNMRPESRSTATSNTGRSTAGLRSQLAPPSRRSEEHTSELQSRGQLVCRLLLEKKKYVKQLGVAHAVDLVQ